MELFKTTPDGIVKCGKRSQRLICNFCPKIVDVIFANNNHNLKQILCLQLTATFKGAKVVKNVDIDFETISKFDPSSIDLRFAISPGKNNKDDFVAYLQSLATNIVPTEKFYIDSFGEWEHNGQYIFCLGDMLIGKNINLDDYYIDPNISQFHMNYTPNTSPQENYEALCHFMEIEDGISDVLMLYVLTSLLRPLYHKAGFKCNYILNLVGKTQSRKTTLAQLASDFFYDDSGKNSNTIRLDSSVNLIQDFLSLFKNLVAIVDDLFRDSCAKSDLKFKAQQILRQVADGTIRQNIQTNSDITNTSLIITAELLLDTVSDLGRTQLIYVKKPINSEKLSKSQAEKCKLYSFYVDFLSWIYESYDDILTSLKIDFEIFLTERSATKMLYMRSFEHAYIAKTTAKYVFKYALEKNLISDNKFKFIQKNMDQIIDDNYQVQLDTLDSIAKSSGETKLNPSKALFCCLKRKILDPTDDPDCFLKGDKLLYIRTEKLQFVLNKNFNFQNSVKYYTNYFKKRNILVQEQSGAKSTKRINNIRYLVIRLDLLLLDVDSTESIIDSFK